MIPDYLAGLKEFCETKEDPTLEVGKHPECKNDFTDKTMWRLLRDAFGSPEKFVWHCPSRSLVRIYTSRVSTQDHTVIHYEKKDNHRVTIMRMPYEDTEYTRKMADQSVKVTTSRVPHEDPESVVVMYLID